MLWSQDFKCGKRPDVVLWLFLLPSQKNVARGSPNREITACACSVRIYELVLVIFVKENVHSFFLKPLMRCEWSCTWATPEQRGLSRAFSQRCFMLWPSSMLPTLPSRPFYPFSFSDCGQYTKYL